MRPVVDLSVYYVTDTPLSAKRGLIETAVAAAHGGATLIQLRDPIAKAGWLLEQARALVAALAPLGVPLIINDRPDVALACGCAGVHVGQDDLPPEAARAVLGPFAIVGLSITTPEELAATPWNLIDHIGVGPVFSRGVKPDAAEPMGLTGLRSCVALARKPVVAIGGIDVERARLAIEAGADGVAAVAAIAGAEDPGRAAGQLRDAVQQGRATRQKTRTRT